MPRAEVTLTFDNGPDPDVTPRVLEVLSQHQILVTFFVLGAKLARHRALTEEAHRRGHWIGNHTMSHSTPLGLLRDPALAREEILETEALIGELAHPDRLFRPFGGGGRLGTHLLNAEALRVLEEQRMTCVLWNAIPRDWADPEGWVETALAQCRAQPWTLMVLHDLPTGAMQHLAAFLKKAQDEGAVFRQDFPPECVPLVRGAARRDLASYVAK